jgi:serine phosphatase RsbU (regulator of sigma subunit)
VKLAKLFFFFFLSLLFSEPAIYAQCSSGNCQDGAGTFLYPGGDKYEGAFVNKKREGKGILTTKKGEVYNGNWKGDRKNGQGDWTLPNGDKFSGSWKNNSRNGQGKYFWVDGSSYVGDWYSNRRYGKGIMTYANGNIYNGNWVDDEYDGLGTFDWTSGITFVGNWKRSIPSMGMIGFPDGQKYKGSWRTSVHAGKTHFDYYTEGEKIAIWQGNEVSDLRKPEFLPDSTNREGDVLVVEDGKPVSLEKKEVEETEVFDEFTKKYKENFNLVMRQLEAEKQVLLENGIKIRDEIERIAHELEGETFNKSRKQQLESHLKGLEESLITNELAFQDARQRTTDVINRMRSTILEQDTKIEVIEAEKEVDKGRIRFFIAIATIGIALSCVLFLIARKIMQQKDEIIEQSSEIEKQNQDITSSLNYAQRIQVAILPKLEEITRTLPNSFVLFKPRDIVSGDFYWFSEFGDKLFLAAADCTGHGVPGAFMSLVGNKLLNEIVNEQKIHDPADILKKLHEGVYEGLKQNESSTQDGMDISLCAIDKKNRIVEFAGAKHPLFIYQNSEFTEIKGDRYPIGGNYYSQERVYTTHRIEVSALGENPHFYLFSDGFRDQFGQGDKKYTKKRFREFLASIQHEPIRYHTTLLEEEFKNWKEEQKQLDDVLVIGFSL